MANFPQYSNVEPQIQETLKSRIGNNVEMSKLMPWIRISSAVDGGCIIGSNLQIDSFSTRYGNSTKSGMIGTNFKGQPVEEEFSTRGLRPSPVIENLNVQNGAEGLTRKASFEIKCFSLGQAEKVCKYFLEPRFYVLVEWGWNTKDSYTSLANLREGNDPGPICEMISYNNLGIVKKKRKDSKGHYDGFLGVITGGGISYGDDETHIIAVEITTTGEIPAYLQSHKGTRFVDSGPYVDSSAKFDKEEIKVEAEKDETDLGRLYFMKMFNDLPPHKQITPVKELIEKTIKTKDGEAKKWASPDNFLNFDDGVVEILSDKLSRGKVQIPKSVIDENAKEDETISVKLPTDTKLINNERYIRMELAWEILNLVSDLKEIPETSCKNPNGGKFQAVSSGISIENTVCRGFKHIFSCDKKKMYIPNTSLPDFGLYKVLTQKEDDPEKNKKNWIDLTEDKPHRIKNSVDGRIGDYKFPEPRPIWVIENGKPAYEDVYNETFSFDDTAYKRSPDAYEWGYLKNLYINFDFFCECLTRNGLFMKDVALDILNGLSTASNMYWNFQLSPRGNSKGDETLQVVDWNFLGIDISQQKDEFKKLLRIQTRGMNSPFLSVNLDLNVPGVLANQIMAQRSELGRNPNDVPSNTINAAGVEQPSQIFMWGNNFDPIELEMVSYRKAFDEDDSSKTENKILRQSISGGRRIGDNYYYGWEYKNSDGTFATKEEYETQENKRKNQIKVNYTSFVNTAGIFPQNNSRKYYEKVKTSSFFGRDAKLNNLIVVGTWDDQKLLKQIENSDLSPEEQTTKNPSLLPIKLTATLPGISGFKVGDIVSFTDLPTKFTDKLYQVFQVNQTISDSGWITEIDFRMRNTPISKIDEVVR